VRVHPLTTLILCLFACLLDVRASARTPTRKGQKPLDVNRHMFISYGSPSWNTDSTRVDSAFLVLRDRGSGKIVQIQLEETEPDSSQFTGQFSVSLGEKDTVSPEIYVPPQDLRQGARNYKKIFDAIQAHRLPRKPVIWTKTEKGQAMLEVYDTREQAERALHAYQEKERLEDEARRKKLIKPLPSETALAAAAQADKQELLNKMATDAAKREAERVRLEQIEKQKRAEREQKAREANQKQRFARQAEARRFALDAGKLYAAGDFKGAEEQFRRAVELDPENHSYYFKYGVSLYRNDKFNEAVVTLNLAESDPEHAAERPYYIGLSYYRMGELGAALKQFATVAETHDPVLSPSALFYRGVIQFTQENYDPAKTAFEAVIDTSNDPRLDEQADAYLDRIASAKMYRKMLENRWTVTGTVGLMYDSNVTLSSDNTSQGTATNVQDGRLLTSGDLNYRPVLGEHHEWSADLSANLINSNKTESVPADTWLYDAALPYSYKGVLFKKGYKLTVTPGAEILYMQPSGESTKELTLLSYMMTVGNTFIMTKSWFADYSLQYRMDDSRTSDSIGPEDADASKWTLGTTQSVFLDKAKKEALIATLDYVLNIAKGDNKKYNRIDLGAMYVRPVRWGASWNLGISVYKLIYPDSDPGREDLDVSVTTGISKPIREWCTWGLTGIYTKNSSNQTAYDYSKYVILTTATFNTIF
jgi:tetratricopeptide (TPR) repeat protein